MAATPKKLTLKKPTAQKNPPKATFEAQLASYSDEFISCRDWGHNWKPATASRDINDGSIRRTLTCSTCGTDRNQTLDNSGFIINTSYVYRAGYQIPGIGRLDSHHRAAIRLASIRRAPAS